MSSTARALIAVLALSLAGGGAYLLLRGAGGPGTPGQASREAGGGRGPRRESNPQSMLGAGQAGPGAGDPALLAPAVAGAALPSVAHPFPTTPQEKVEYEKRVDEIALTPEPQIRQTATTIAERYDHVKLKEVDCVDRPCRLVVEATSNDEAQKFIDDVSQYYQGHVRSWFHPTKLKGPDGKKTRFLRGTITIGTNGGEQRRFRPLRDGDEGGD